MLFQYYVLLIIIFSLNKLLEHNLILRDHVIPTVCTWSSLHPEQYQVCESHDKCQVDNYFY